MDFFRKANNEFIPMFKSPKVDWCLLMAGKVKINSFLKMFITACKTEAPKFFHNCPYAGLQAGTNASIFKQFLSFYPTGTFKLITIVEVKSKEMLRIILDFFMF